MGKLFWPLIIIVGGLWLLGSSSDELSKLEDSFSTETTEVVAEEPVIEEPYWDPPAGFSLWDDGDAIAWRWVEDPDCDRGERCWQVEVVARDGCPDGLYVSMNKLAGETVVGYTNDSLNSVEAEQVARLTLSDYGDQAVKGRLTEINCY